MCIYYLLCLICFQIARNNFQPKPIFDFLAGIMTAQTSLTHLDIEVGILYSKYYFVIMQASINEGHLESS